MVAQMKAPDDWWERKGSNHKEIQNDQKDYRTPIGDTVLR